MNPTNGFIVSQTLDEDARAGNPSAIMAEVTGADPNSKRYLAVESPTAQIDTGFPIFNSNISEAFVFPTKASAAQAASTLVGLELAQAGVHSLWDVEEAR